MLFRLAQQPLYVLGGTEQLVGSKTRADADDDIGKRILRLKAPRFRIIESRLALYAANLLAYQSNGPVDGFFSLAQIGTETQINLMLLLASQSLPFLFLNHSE